MMVHSDFSLTIFFPAHNEIESLGAITENALMVAAELSTDFEIIIVNDGSTDGTRELADNLAEKHPEVRVIHHSKNRGYGGALQSGFMSATKDLVFYTDADAQFNLKDLTEVFPMIKDADVVTCYRVDRSDPWHRKLNTWLFEQAVFIGLGLKVRDPDCAFKIYRREVLKDMNLISEGAMIDVEMLLKAQRAGFRIVQMGVRHYPRQAGVPSGGNPLVIFRAMSEMWNLWRKVGSR